jgi:hypothetical protein
VGFHLGFLDRVVGPETMLEAGARLQVAQLGLHHRPEVPRRVVPEFDDAAGLAIENNDHSAPDLGCWYRHDFLSIDCREEGLKQGSR